MAENPDPAACAIGLDVGGTKIAAGLVAFPSGAVLARRTIPTLPRRGGETVLNDTLSLAEELKTEAGKSNLELLGIGVGVPELVDPEGNITSAHTLAWQGDGVQAAFSRWRRPSSNRMCERAPWPRRCSALAGSTGCSST